MFKKSLLALSLITLSGTALSAPPVANLKVTGQISPPTCTINGLAEDTLTYNFDISTSLFPASGESLVMEGQSKNIEVVCDATTYLAFSAMDATTIGKVDYADTFSLGVLGPNNANIGYYTVTMENATVKTSADATATNVGVRTGNDYATSSHLRKMTSSGMSSGWATSSTQLAAAQIFAADFIVQPTIYATMKSNTDGVQLDGLAVLTFAFGM